MIVKLVGSIRLMLEAGERLFLILFDFKGIYY